MALVENGDLIEIDIPNARPDLKVDDEVTAQRKACWQTPKQKIRKGYLSIYSKMANSKAKGASLKYD